MFEDNACGSGIVTDELIASIKKDDDSVNDTFLIEAVDAAPSMVG
jgi:hypothetical protein